MNTDKQPDEEILEVRSGGPRVRSLCPSGFGVRVPVGLGCIPQHRDPFTSQKRSEHHYLGFMEALLCSQD